jgi:uncharacterized protein (DUF1330 family)
MKNKYAVPVAILAGIGVGAAAVQTLHAQAKPPVYVVSEIEVSNVDAYIKEFVPAARAAFAKTGGKALGASTNVTMLEGEPQKLRVTVTSYDSLESAKASRTSAEYKEARKIGDKYAKFRAYVVEGIPQ